MREQIQYDTRFRRGTSAATPQEIWNATVKVYKQLGLTQYLDPLKQQLIDKVRLTYQELGEMVSMNRITGLRIIGGEDEFCQELYNHVKHDIPKEWAKKYEYSGRSQLNLPLEQNSPSYQYVMEMAQKHDLHPTVFQIVNYTKLEIENSEYYEMRIPEPLELEGTDAANYGTQYADGCPYCGLGGRPISDVLVDRRFIKNYKIGTLFPDIYVSESLKELILESHLTGVSFEHEVKDYKGREMPKCSVMDIPNVLPPMSDSAWLIKDKDYGRYKECGHQVTYLRSDIKYEREKLDEAQDFNLTNEFVDNFRLRQIIVSARVRQLFKRNKVYAAFFPVAML